MKIRIHVHPKSGKITYDFEGTLEEIHEISDNDFTKLDDKLRGWRQHIEGARIETLPPKAVSVSPIQDFSDLSEGRVVLGPNARNLTIRETLGLVIMCSKRLGKEQMTGKEIHGILRENGMPYDLTSVLARLSEMARDGYAVRVGRGTYKLSTFGETWIKEELEKKQAG